MHAIQHYLKIKSTPENIFKALTTEDGLKSWWAKQAIAKPEVGFVNIFTFGKDRNEMKVAEIIPNQKVEWQCLQASAEWIGTTLSFNLEEKEGKTILRFTQDGWREINDFYAMCNYEWAKFMTSLKSYCETGSGTPS